jgi:hypothetical protein
MLAALSRQAFQIAYDLLKKVFALGPALNVPYIKCNKAKIWQIYHLKLSSSLLLTNLLKAGPDFKKISAKQKELNRINFAHVKPYRILLTKFIFSLEPALTVICSM